VAANMSTERRGFCMLCPSRVDPGRWTCHRCHARLWREITEELIDSAIQDR